MGWKERRLFLDAQHKLSLNDYLGAENLLEDVLAQDPKHAEAYLHLAYVRMRQGKLDEALEDISKGIELRPDNGVYPMVKGEILLKKSLYKEAYDSLKKAVDLERDNGRAYFHLGQAAAQLGQSEEAAEYIEIALQFERDYVLSHWMVFSQGVTK